MSSPPYTKALVIGATSGIGEALAARLLAGGTSVVVAGRRQDRLDRFLAAHSSAAAERVDITDLAGIPAFARRVAERHPDLDCIVVNAGIQRAFDFARPESVDLGALDEEWTTNYVAPVHLAVALLPLLQARAPRPTHLVFVSATLGLVPGMLRTGNYNAAKGALHNWLLVLREQLKRKPGNNVRVVEVFPPAVRTELHDERHQPDLKDGGSIGMPLDEFTEEMYVGLMEGGEQVGVGHAKASLEGFEVERQKAFHAMVGMVDGLLKNHLK